MVNTIMGLDSADFGLLENIYREIEKMNKLKEQELQQQMFFIELIEECLPIDDARKKQIHQKTIRRH